MSFEKKLVVSQPSLSPSSPPLPPPPPPPPLLPVPNVPNQIQFTGENKSNFVSDEEELSLVCERIKSCANFFCKVFHSHYMNLKPQLQVGPMCGLVALSIASTITQNPINVNNIFKTALSLGYTKQGEIFNVKFLADLAEKCCGFKAMIIKGDLKNHVQCVINNLMEKNLILVPYDADHNHSPCCKKGQKAHWAVISGFVIFSESADDRDVTNIAKLDSNFCLCNCEQNKTCNDYPLKFINDKGRILITKKTVVNEAIFEDAKESKIYLIGRQGKSKHLGLWLFDKMAESNNNLMFFPKTRKIEDYVLPQGGLSEGLKSKAIILKTNFISQKNF